MVGATYGLDDLADIFEFTAYHDPREKCDETDVPTTISRLYDDGISTNKELVAALRKCLEELHERRLTLQKQDHALSEEIERLKTIPTEKKDVKAVTKLSFSQFGFPYFKNKDGEELHVYEDILGLNKAFRFKPTYDFPKPMKMLPKEEAKLEEAVLRELVRIALDKMINLREMVKTVLNEKAATGLPHNTLSRKLDGLNKQIEYVDVNPKRWYRNRGVYQLDLINWKKIAQEVFPKQFFYNGTFLRQWWKCFLDPSVQRGPLTTKEIELLKSLTKDCNPDEGIDFHSIATKIAETLKSSRKRHWFKLGQYYQKKLNLNNRKFGWTKEEGERLEVIHLKYSTECPSHERKHVDWNKIRTHFPGRTVSQMVTYLHRLSATPVSSQAKPFTTPIKSVTTPTSIATPKSRGRPMRVEKSALDRQIAELLAPFKSIRQGRPRLTSLGRDGRVNGIMLSAIHRLLPITLDLKNVPREANDLVAAGIAEKDVGAVQVLLSLPKLTPTNLESKFPANLASITGLRGLLLTQEANDLVNDTVEVGIDEDISETEVDQLCYLGDRASDEKLLLSLESIFGWAYPFFSTEASGAVSGTELGGP